MFKRVVWTAVGYGAGLGTSLYVQRKVKRRVQRVAVRYGSTDVVARGRELADAARFMGHEVVAAVRDGRATMLDTEASLRAEFAPGSPASRHDRPSPTRARGRHPRRGG